MSALIFLKFDPEIKGGSLNEKHKDEMEILSVNGGLSQATSGPRSSGRGTTGQADHQPIQVSKYIDGSLPQLLKLVDGGKPAKGVVMSCYRANAQGGEEPHLYLKVEMEDVLVSHLSYSNDIASFSLDYGAATFIFTNLKPDGSPDGNQAVKVDLRTGTRS